MVSNGTNGAEILAQSDLGANDFKVIDEAAVCVDYEKPDTSRA